MQQTIFFPLWSTQEQIEDFLNQYDVEIGQFEMRRFPDQESYVRIDSQLKGKTAWVLAQMHDPNPKILDLVFFLQTLRECGAKRIVLVAPYLPYMRQDKRFKPGECFSLVVFANLLSPLCDELITIDPHLHRTNDLNEVYHTQTKVLSAMPKVAAYIQDNIQNPLLIGPDEESQQWVSQIAAQIHCPYVVFRKERSGDKSVKILSMALDAYSALQPIIIDDIISSGHTMIETVKDLIQQINKKPICIGVHGLFADDALANLMRAGCQKVITCNTIAHSTNQIQVLSLVHMPTQ